MKKLILPVLFGLLIFSSCKKLLDEDVRNQISNQYLNTPSGIEDGVRASYSYLRSWYGQQSAGWLTVFGTDEYTNGAADATFNGYTANLNSSNSVPTGVWNSLYQGINTCNAVIDAAATVSMPEATKKIRVAEARFLRGQYYFLLVQTFGPLHLSLHPTEGASTVASRSPINEVYKAIVDDMTYAVANLPVTTTEYGRVTAAAAKHGLAKVYLTRAGTTASEATDYAMAATLAKDVIATSGAKLLDNFEQIFAQGVSQKNTETLLACQYSINPLAGGINNGSGNQAHLFYAVLYESQPGMQRAINLGRPYRHFRPTNYMLGLYNKSIDARFDKSFKTTWLCNKPGTYTINAKSVQLKAGDTAFVIIDHAPTVAERNAKRYKLIAPSETSVDLFPQLNKFADSLRADINNVNGVKDFIIFRLGETYLIAAEALMMSGKSDEAVGYINTLRRRAAVAGTTQAATDANKTAMEVKVSDINLNFILDERARELSGEYTRWFDLVRTKTLLERVKAYNTLAAPNIKDFHVLRPIPQTQIDRTEGTSTAFPQNPGY